MKKRDIAISSLSEYAADPEGFVKRRGGVRSKAAIKHGDAFHNNLGRGRKSTTRRIILAIVCLSAALIMGLLL